MRIQDELELLLVVERQYCQSVSCNVIAFADCSLTGGVSGHYSITCSSLVLFLRFYPGPYYFIYLFSNNFGHVKRRPVTVHARLVPLGHYFVMFITDGTREGTIQESALFCQCWYIYDIPHKNKEGKEKQSLKFTVDYHDPTERATRTAISILKPPVQ